MKETFIGNKASISQKRIPSIRKKLRNRKS